MLEGVDMKRKTTNQVTIEKIRNEREKLDQQRFEVDNKLRELEAKEALFRERRHALENV